MIRIGQEWNDSEGRWRVVGIKGQAVWLTGPLPLRGMRTVTRDALQFDYELVQEREGEPDAELAPHRTK